MPDPAIGHGSTFHRSSDATSGGSFATIGEVLSITPPALSRDAVDVTHMESTERWREFIGGLKDGGEVSVELNFDPGDATTTSLLADLNANTAGYYKITFPDATAWGFAALLTGFESSDPLDDKMTATVTFKLTGKPGFIA